MRVSNKTIYILGISTLLVLIAIVLPLLNLIQKSSQELASQKKELILYSQQGSDLEGTIEKYNSFKARLEKIDNSFINKSFPVEFKRFLEGIVPASQGKMITSAAKEGTDNTLSFNVSFTGSFSNLLRFIDKLENSPYFIEIVNLNARQSKTGLLNEITANLEIMVSAK